MSEHIGPQGLEMTFSEFCQLDLDGWILEQTYPSGQKSEPRIFAQVGRGQRTVFFGCRGMYQRFALKRSTTAIIWGPEYQHETLDRITHFGDRIVIKNNCSQEQFVFHLSPLASQEREKGSAQTTTL